MCGMWMWHLWLWELHESDREGQINEKEHCGEGQLANANNLIEIALQVLVWNKNNYSIQIKHMMNWKYCDPFSKKRDFLPLGVIALVLLPLTLAFWLGVVKTFLLGRAFFLLDVGVRGGGNTNISRSFSWTAIFSLFSLVCSWSVSLRSWRCCVAVRPLSGVGL